MMRRAILRTPGNEGSDSSLKNRAFQHHPVLTFEADDADIGAQTVHLPVITAAGMLFFEADHIAQFDFHNHWLLPGDGAVAVNLVSQV